MRLKLVLRGPERMMGAQPEKTLDNGSLVVGRSPSAGWVLPDPERIVSKTHCRIDRDFNGFVLTDTSTNGVEINDEPVGFGMPRLLANGDVLKLGDVVVLVLVETPAPETRAASAAAATPPAAPSAHLSAGPFGIADPLSAPQADSVESAPASPAQLPGDEILDDWWKPEAATEPPAAPIPVDIFPQGGTGEIPRTMEPQETLPSGNGDVVSFVESRADIDLMALARAVNEAGLVLDEDDRRRFFERLRGLLAGGGGRMA